jgi:hypothetical protein
MKRFKLEIIQEVNLTETGSKLYRLGFDEEFDTLDEAINSLKNEAIPYGKQSIFRNEEKYYFKIVANLTDQFNQTDEFQINLPFTFEFIIAYKKVGQDVRYLDNEQILMNINDLYKYIH